jgi:hypothetical protein
MVYLFVEGNLCHICFGNCMYSVPFLLICFLFYSHKQNLESIFCVLGSVFMLY